VNYIYTKTTDAVSTYLAGILKTHLLQGEKVLWLLSGGSAITTAVTVARQLHGYDVSKLAVTLVDERYGAIGNANENWQQLLDAGFVLDGADLYRPLQGKDRAKTTRAYGQWLATHYDDSDYSIGLFGIGTDGHTAGLKPGTPALQATGWATDFVGDDFERFTVTFDTIKQLDEVIIQVIGSDKAEMLDKFQKQNLSLDVQPAQILKSIKNSTLFTDYKEISL
jgi:6-phosphogluconolactonase/glucosamine-6-phosphate isomerase/deaminase